MPVELTILRPSNRPVRALDGMADLKLHLREAIAEPTDLIKQGTAPPPYFFALEPSEADHEQRQKFAALLGASALARILAGMNLVRSGPDHSGGGDGGDSKGDEAATTVHYSLRNPREYVTAFNEKTEATINAFTKGPLASMYEPSDGGVTTSLDLEITHAELHATVLPHIFGGLHQVGKTHLAELDKVLTNFTAALRPFQVLPPSHGHQGGKERDGGDGEQQPELKLAVAVNYVKSIDITGGSGDNGGIYIHTPCTRIAIFSVKLQHWEAALQKPVPSKGAEVTPVVKHYFGVYDAVVAAAATGDTATSAAADSAATASTPTASTPTAAASTTTAHTSGAGALPGWFGWKGKPKPPRKEERFKFTLNMTVLEIEFNDGRYKANKPKFEAIFKNMAKDDEKLGPIAESGGLDALGRSTCTVYKAVEA